MGDMIGEGGNRGYLGNDVNTAFTYEILKNLEDLTNL